VTWAAKADQLDQFTRDAARNGVQLGAVISGSRQRPDGVVLSWRLTDPWTVVADGIAPLFIDWGQSPHPAQTAAAGLSLFNLRAVHPNAKRVEQMLRQLGLDLPVNQGPAPTLIAIIDAPRGLIELC
jgi:hypothetical protein